MKRVLLPVLLIMLQPLFGILQAQTRVVVLGSSTAAGTGASVYDSSWVGKLQLEYRKNTTAGNPDTVVTNLAVGGTTTYYAMPTGYTPPPGRPLPDPAHNITKALSFSPAVIIINFPTNDIGSSYAAKEYMDNLRYLYQYINSAGVKAYVSTTQPRSQFDFAKRRVLRQLVDSINNNFGMYAINFWEDLVTNDDQYNLGAEVNSGDGVHVNNFGHRLLFQRVQTKNIFISNAAASLLLIDFGVQLQNKTAVITWQTGHEEANTFFELQRGEDGQKFETIINIKAKGTSQVTNYSWTDNNLLPGQNFYRLKIVESNRVSYSKVVSIYSKKTFAIDKIYATSSALSVMLITDKTRMITASIINSLGETVEKLNYTLPSPSVSLTIPVSKLPAGQYFLRIESLDAIDTKAFQKLP
jgi:lysophospholipase L1-like esterase